MSFWDFFSKYYQEILIGCESVAFLIVNTILGSKLKKKNDLLSDQDQALINYSVILQVPRWIREANDLFPNEGIKTGPLKRQYVINQFKNSGIDPLPNSFMIDHFIEVVLNCDKNILQEVSQNEENESQAVERSQSVRQDGEQDESPQRQAYYVPRRD